VSLIICPPRAGFVTVLSFSREGRPYLPPAAGQNHSDCAGDRHQALRPGHAPRAGGQTRGARRRANTRCPIVGFLAAPTGVSAAHL